MTSDNDIITPSKADQSNGTWLHEYEGIKYPMFLPAEPRQHLHDIKHMPYKDGDTFVCSYPKSGTHWVLEIVSMLKRGKADHSTEMNFLDIIPTSACDPLPSPRVFASHLRWSQLPECARASGAKVVYCLRNPKDLAVSLYNFNSKMRDLRYKGTWEAFLKEFQDGNVAYSSWFDHVTSWERARDEDNNHQILFVHYEDIQKDARVEIQRIADFLEVDVKKDLIDKICQHTSLSNMRSHKLKYHPYPPEMMDPNHQTNLFRNGKVGDWKNWFSHEQKQCFDKLFSQRMKHSALRFKYQLCRATPLQPCQFRFNRE